jgi:hypothetical protein
MMIVLILHIIIKIMVRYRNRYGAEYTFTKQEDGNVLWEGDFEFIRAGNNFIDPSGGPYIEIGQMLSHVIHGEGMNVIVEGFTNTENGILINTKLHEYDPNDMSHLANLNIIGGIINTTEK